MGALFLKPLDDRMAELGCFYVRFMDDWVVLVPIRWKLRQAIKAVNEVMNDQGKRILFLQCLWSKGFRHYNL
jgi:hypothetical protein